MDKTIIKNNAMGSFFLKTKLFFGLLVAKVLGFKFNWVATEEEKKMVYRLRYKVYRTEGHIEENKEEEMKDQYEKEADNLLVTYKGKAIATLRIIYDSEVGLPTEKMFNIELPGDRNDVVEVSRLSILPEFRSKNFVIRSRIVVGAMMAKLYLFSKKHGIKIWLFNMSERLKKSYEKTGLTIHSISQGPPTEKHMKEREIIKRYFNKTTILPYYIDVDCL